MNYSVQEVLQYVNEEDVKFIRLAFCDVRGVQKNISIMPAELERAFRDGIALDASAIEGFGDESCSDLFLRPDPTTLSVLPWRPEHGRVVRMFCSIHRPSGEVFEGDTRSLLARAVADAKKAGVQFSFGAEMEFYLFRLDETGTPTKTPYDTAGYMDIAPEDKGENVRREICLTLEQMGIQPESSHHEEGPGQNEIDFRYADPLSCADNVMTVRTVIKTVAGRNGLFADFSPKPLPRQSGNGFHINLSAKRDAGDDLMPHVIAGLLLHVRDCTLFFNPAHESYARFGQHKAPRYISWSSENRSQLVRIPAAVGEYRRAELRSPDPLTNPYLAFSLLIYAVLDGISRGLQPPAAADVNLFAIGAEVLKHYEKLPQSLDEAVEAAKNSDFVRAHLPMSVIETYCK